MKKIYIHCPGRSACDLYRSFLPFRMCREPLLERGIQLDLGQAIPDGYDAYLFRRTAYSFHPMSPPTLLGRIMKIFRNANVSWDLDDDLFNIPSWSPANEMMPPGAHEMLAECLTRSDRLTASTAPLAAAMDAVVGDFKTRVLPNLISLADWSFPTERREGPVRILWAGSTTHARDLDLIVPALDRLIADLGRNIHVYFAGQIPEHFVPNETNFTKYKNIVTYIGSTEVYFYPAFMNAIGPDIALLPLADEPFNHCKSNIKYLEMTMAGAACVASPATPYAGSIDPGRDGYIANNENEWYEHIHNLVRSASDRSMARFRAQAKVSERWSWGDRAHGRSAGRDAWVESLASLV